MCNIGMIVLQPCKLGCALLSDASPSRGRHTAIACTEDD
jgi:hypothetical protein